MRKRNEILVDALVGTGLSLIFGPLVFLVIFVLS